MKMRSLILVLLLHLSNAAEAGELVVVVNAASGAGQLSRDQVINIFLGRFRQFPSGLAAEPIDQPDDGPLRAQFYRLLVDKQMTEINAYWARLIFSGRTSPPLKAKSSDEVLRLLSSRRGGIAYVNKSEVNHLLTIVFTPNHDQ